MLGQKKREKKRVGAMETRVMEERGKLSFNDSRIVAEYELTSSPSASSVGEVDSWLRTLVFIPEFGAPWGMACRMRR